MLARVAVAGTMACADERQAPLPPQGPEALLADGEAYYRRAAHDSAEVRFQAALALARERGETAAEAGALAGLGSVARQRSDYRTARRLLEEALAVQQARGITAHLWRANNLLGLIAYDVGRYYEALERHQTASQVADASGDTVNLAKSRSNVALALTELGDFAAARRLLQQALPVARASGDSLFAGRVLVNLGMLAVRTGDPAAAISYLDAALAPITASEDAAGALNRLGQLGTAYAAMGEPGRAIAHLDSALQRARASDLHQEAASNLEHLAAVYRDAGDHARALRMFTEARALNDSLGLADEAAFDLRNIAEIHRELGNLPLARRAAEEALAVHSKLGERLEVLHEHLLLAQLSRDDDDRPSAGRHLGRATAMADSLDAAGPQFALALVEARLADQDGDNRAVQRAASAALRTLAEGGTDAEWEVHWLQGRALRRSGALRAGLDAFRRAARAADRVRGDLASGLLRTRYQDARASVHEDLVDVLLRLGRTDEAFEAADAARGRVLVEHLATLATSGSSTPREMAEEERQLLRRIEGVTTDLERLGRDSSANEDRDALLRERSRLQENLERARAEYARAVTSNDERATDARVLAGGTATRRADVRASLRPGEAVIEYFLFPGRLQWFVVTRDRIETGAHAVDRESLATRVRLVRELSGRAGSSTAIPALEALHDDLLGDVRRSGALDGVRTLVYVPHGALEYVPFAALRDRHSGRYLVEDYDLLHAPAAGVLPVIRARAAPGTGSGMAVAFAPFPVALPGSAAEGRALASAVPGSRTVSGAAATERRLREALAGGGIVHVATHGVLSARNPLFSRVELAPGRSGGGPEDDGRLEVHEVHRMPIGAWLTFLSGCETGLGASGAAGMRMGEDYATLTRAFLGSGAGNVIATLWRVEDEGSAELTRAFYRRLSAAGPNGDSREGGLVGALSAAQRQLLRDPRWSSPFYWAGFRLTGRG